jgi:hypothetical protein
MVSNYSGYGDGLPVSFWPTDTASLSNPDAQFYGQDNIMDVEAYAPGSSTTGQTPPSVQITSPVSGTSGSPTYEHAPFAVNVNATTTSGTISSVDLYLNGTEIGTDTTAPYSFTLNPGNTAISGDISTGLNALNGDNTLTAVATSNGISSTSSPVTFTVNYGAINSPSQVDATDAHILNTNYYTSGKTYSQGDLNGDNTVNALDDHILNANYYWGVNIP